MPKVDKFYRTDLEDILRSRGIKTVAIAGTTAEGAVRHTATGAAMRGDQVVVPVDGMSAGSLYAEPYTARHMRNVPGTRKRTILSRLDRITLRWFWRCGREGQRFPVGCPSLVPLPSIINASGPCRTALP